ncbi:MAG: NAD-dependent epimerase/dehydratase family protein [Candidatus Levybacteria bacterium]|nr:NAD-dependent epimerase/dehydratase family protein [Candidatus Levybacteria bacterium]MDZ4227738.1 NAD-dependent epimerase/dehydratase family protein [Candidatus Levybacteria bacterium]
MQIVLVAGGAGFIGSHLCKSLLKDNYKVICVDNFITGDKNNLKDLLKDPEFTLLEYDIIKPIQSSELGMQSLDYIFHLASPASPNQKSTKSYINHPIETLLANSQGTYNLLELARQFNAKFLYASSSEIYGDPAISPQKEDYFGNVNPNGIRSVYDEGKRFGEAITFSYVRKHNLDARVIRIFNTYGPIMQVDDGRVVSNFINQAIENKPITVYGKGTQTRSLCYIEDMVLGIKLAMFIPNTKGEVFNLGNPDERSVLDIAKLIKSMAESASEIVFEDLPIDDPKARKPDIEKAKRILGWEPKVANEDGLRKTIGYFKSI